jgi:hypothetical protein
MVAVVAAGMVAACHSDDSATVAVSASGGSSAHHPALPGTSGAALGIQISPTPTHEFDTNIHDYVMDCGGGQDVEIAVADPVRIGFAYLGYTGHPTFVRPDRRYQQMVSLSAGQRVSISIADVGVYSFRCLPAGFPPLTVVRNGTPQAQWYLFSLRDYTILTDSYGTPVWWLRTPDVGGTDAKVLGSDRIVWTPGGNGTYVIRSFDGRILNTLTGNLDFHELQPTPAGTFLAIRYVTRVCPPDCADLSPWGGNAQSSAIDGEIIEIDQNSNVLWSWRTRDHIALSETGDTGWLPSVDTDIIHMNAVEPDGTDGVLLSARHLNAIYHITKSTGAVDWKIGGTPRAESLAVIGDPRPDAIGANGQPLSGQHDVRKWPDGSVSVHDNGTLVGRPPVIIRYRIDTTNRTAGVVEQIHDERASPAFCCGSARLLPGGNWVAQWGGTPYLTELDPQGAAVLTIQYNLGGVFSYRGVAVPPGVLDAKLLRDGMDVMSQL